ncbi:MAG: exopolysaccharide biosynthesis protein [Alkalilacustris sp.]
MSRPGSEGDPPDLLEILDSLRDLPEDGRVSVGDVLDQLGVRSFAPVLMLVSLLLVSPLSGIPGTPTVSALLLGLIVVQMLLGRDALWLPGFLRSVTVPAGRLRQALEFLRRPVRVVSPLLQPRLLVLTGRTGGFVVLLTCLAITLTMPVMELLPLAISIAGLAMACFAVGLMLRDGVMVLAGYGVVLIAVMGLRSLVG